MCFSASASFTSGVLLLPAGIYCVRKALHLERKYLLISSFIFIFSLQQFIEGSLWLALAAEHNTAITIFSRFFLFFSHLLWLVLAPVAAYSLEDNGKKKAIFKYFILSGLIFGISLYLPLLMNKDWLSVHIVNYSIYYETRLLYDSFISINIVALLYAAIITLPMVLSSNRNVRIFGTIIFLSIAPAYLVYYYAFISVWCFGAAILSLYIIHIISRLARL